MNDIVFVGGVVVDVGNGRGEDRALGSAAAAVGRPDEEPGGGVVEVDVQAGGLA